MYQIPLSNAIDWEVKLRERSRYISKRYPMKLSGVINTRCERSYNSERFAYLIWEYLPTICKVFSGGWLTAAQICGEDVLGSDQQLFPQVSRLRGAVRQQLQHPLHHLLGVLPNHVLTHTHVSHRHISHCLSIKTSLEKFNKQVVGLRFYLVDPDNVSQEWQGLDLCGNKICIKLLVEQLVLPVTDRNQEKL